MTLLIPEILDLVQQAKTKEEKVQLLRKHQTDCLIVLMRINFDPMLWMDLPEGEPPYKKEPDAPLGLSPSNLYNEFRKFYIWLSPNTGLSKFKKESLFVNLLESIHFREAEIVLLCKDRKLKTKYKSITEDIVREAYPDALTPKDKLPKKEEKVKVPLA